MKFFSSIQALAIMGVLDGILTFLMLTFGMSQELNPLLAWACQISPILFLVMKFVLMGSILWVLSCIPDRTPKQWTIRFGVLVFTSAVIYQCYLFSLFVRF